MAKSWLFRSATYPRRIAMQTDALPLFLRIRIWASKYIYLGRNRGGSVENIVRLPFTKVLKLNTTWQEVEAMEYVRSHTTVPLPKVYEVYEEPNGTCHIVMESLPGSDADYQTMSPERVRAFGEQLAGYLDQLRSLEPPAPGFVGSVNQESLIDHRAGHLRFGPFHSVDDFHSYLRLGGCLDQWLYDPVVKTIHGRLGAYRVKFTHADLNPSNIQYYKGRITGIIDWEFAGWYPEYWEYTKMWWATHPAYRNFFEAIEGTLGIEKYPEELKAEREIRRCLSPAAYDGFYEQPDHVAAFYKSINRSQGQLRGSTATSEG